MLPFSGFCKHLAYFFEIRFSENTASSLAQLFGGLQKNFLCPIGYEHLLPAMAQKNWAVGV